MTFYITSLTSYPVKGLPGQNHDACTLLRGEVMPGDRAFGITSGTEISQEAPADSWLKKAHFLQMMKHEALAAFDLHYEAETSHLSLRLAGTSYYNGCLTNQADANRLCEMIASHLALPASTPALRLFHLTTGGLTDTKTPYIAFGNEASVSQFASYAGLADDDRRYRLNVMLSGAPAFSELDLIGKSARLGGAEVSFIEPIGRCAAIEVDPETAERRTGLVQELATATGATDLGVFASVTKSGRIAIGDKLELC